MSLNVRTFTMIGQFAKLANTNIPPIPVSGQVYRDPNVSKEAIETGQAYDSIGLAELWNQLMYMATGIAQLSESFGFVPFSPLTNYTGDAAWCMGQDGVPYRAAKDSGPGDALNPGVGAKPPPDAEYWESMADYIARIWNSGGGGGDSSGLVYPSAFYDFYEQSPPTGWMVRNGGMISSANVVVPKLWEALQKPENAWKLKTESQWQSMSQSAPWNGIGGVPFFVLDTAAKTVRLPDTRGMYKEDAGSDGLTVGGVHGDAMQKITGTSNSGQQTGSPIYWANTSGAFYQIGTTGYVGQSGHDTNNALLGFDSSRVVRTANKTQPRAFGMLGCVYVGVIAN